MPLTLLTSEQRHDFYFNFFAVDVVDTVDIRKVLKCLPGKDLSFNQKAAILEEISRPNFSKEKILKDYQISKTCFYKILKEKDSILRVSSEKSISTFKKFGKIKQMPLKSNFFSGSVLKSELYIHISTNTYHAASLHSRNLYYLDCHAQTMVVLPEASHCALLCYLL